MSRYLSSLIVLASLCLWGHALGQGVSNGGGLGVASPSGLTNCINTQLGSTPCDINHVGPATVRQITSRVALPGVISGSNTQDGWRAWQMAYDPVSALEVCFYNGYIPSGGVETGSGGTATYRVYVEYPHGTWTTLTWGGAGSGTVANNSTGCTDLTSLGFTIPPYTRFRITGDVSIPSGHVVSSGWSNVCDRANGDEFLLGASGYGHGQDDTVLGASTPNNAAQCYYPALVMGYTDKSVWGLVGDSIANGVNDMASDPSGARGLYGRAMAVLGPHINYGVSGDQSGLYSVSANSTNRTALLAQGGATSILLQLGVNDIFTASKTADQLVTTNNTIVSNLQAAIPNIHVYWVTITPSTTSTDGFATTANQTTSSVNSNNRRTQYNDFLRGYAAAGWTSTCTLNSTTAVTGCTSLPVTTVAPGMNVTGTGIAASTTISAVNLTAGTITLSQNATLSQSSTLTLLWPSMTSTFPTSAAGIVDVARLLEGASYQSAGPVNNGGVWLAGYAGQTDGLHCNLSCDYLAQPPMTNMLSVLR